jgi:ribosome-associated protein
MRTKQQGEIEKDPVDELLDPVVTAIEDMKGVDMKLLDVSELTSITDRMIVVSGTSKRHLKSIADHVALEAKKAGFLPLGIEGGSMADWVLIDLGDVVVHVMLPLTREFYALEKLWSVGPVQDS